MKLSTRTGMPIHLIFILLSLNLTLGCFSEEKVAFSPPSIESLSNLTGICGLPWGTSQGASLEALAKLYPSDSLSSDNLGIMVHPRDFNIDTLPIKNLILGYSSKEYEGLYSAVFILHSPDGEKLLTRLQAQLGPGTSIENTAQIYWKNKKVWVKFYGSDPSFLVTLRNPLPYAGE